MRNYLLTLPFSLLALGSQAKEKQPNILWIITDDQRADALACWNQAMTGKSESALGYVSSPHIDQLAAEGTLFTYSFCNSPVSAPSRSSMHTGKYPHHNAIADFRLTHNKNEFCHPLLPEVMQEQGYKAMQFGKLGSYIFKFQTPMRYESARMYDESVIMENDLERMDVTDWCKQVIYDKGKMLGNRERWFHPDGTITEYYLSRSKKGKQEPEDRLIMEEFDRRQHVIRAPVGGTAVLAGESPMPTHKTLDGRIAEEFKTYLQRENQSYNILNGRKVKGPDPTQPQFINLGFHFPHTAVMPSKEYRDQFLSRSYRIPELSKEEWEKMPAQVQQWQKKGDVTTLTPKEKEQMIRDYYAFCAMGDQLVGEAVAEFKQYCARHQQEYIIVFVCGDHGWHLGEQGVAAKASGYLKSNQTAVIMVGSDKKKFPAGKVVTDFVEYVDFYPTFIAAAGVDETDERFSYLDGRDLVKTMQGKVKPRDYVLSESNVVSGPRGTIRSKNFAFSMRLRKHNPAPNPKFPPLKDIEWALEAPREQMDMMLFDLRNDPNELNNVANDPKYAALADWYRVKLGNIMLGDDRVECDWATPNTYKVSSFAQGSDDKRLKIPKKLIPKI